MFVGKPNPPTKPLDNKKKREENSSNIATDLEWRLLATIH